MTPDDLNPNLIMSRVDSSLLMAIALGIHRPTVQKYLRDRKGSYHVVMMHNGKDRLFTVRGNLIN